MAGTASTLLEIVLPLFFYLVMLNWLVGRMLRFAPAIQINKSECGSSSRGLNRLLLSSSFSTQRPRSPVVLAFWLSSLVQAALLVIDFSSPYLFGWIAWNACVLSTSSGSMHSYLPGRSIPCDVENGTLLLSRRRWAPGVPNLSGAWHPGHLNAKSTPIRKWHTPNF